jgi:hypothetical protein
MLDISKPVLTAALSLPVTLPQVRRLRNEGTQSKTIELDFKLEVSCHPKVISVIAGYLSVLFLCYNLFFSLDRLLQQSIPR